MLIKMQVFNLRSDSSVIIRDYTEEIIKRLFTLSSQMMWKYSNRAETS